MATQQSYKEKRSDTKEKDPYAKPYRPQKQKPYRPANLKGRDIGLYNRRVKQREIVTKGCFEGKSVDQISVESNIPPHVVKAIISKLRLRQNAEEKMNELKQEVCIQKVPILKDIVGLSLNLVKDFLTELSGDDVRKSKLTVKDAKDLASMGKELNEFMRLELGQETSRVGVVTQYSIKQTADILNELRAIDPINDYPKLPDIEAEHEVVQDENADTDGELWEEEDVVS